MTTAASTIIATPSRASAVERIIGSLQEVNVLRNLTSFPIVRPPRDLGIPAQKNASRKNVSRRTPPAEL
jgi:hypothetical protein